MLPSQLCLRYVNFLVKNHHLRNFWRDASTIDIVDNSYGGKVP